MTATIRYYCRMANTTKGKTPRYTIVQEAGYFEPMQYLKGRDGRISMYLVEKLREGDRVPAMRLQAKGSLNFTGLKEYFINGKLSDTRMATLMQDQRTAATTNLIRSIHIKMMVFCLLFIVTRAIKTTLHQRQ